jgi:hypothetical protein
VPEYRKSEVVIEGLPSFSWLFERFWSTLGTIFQQIKTVSSRFAVKYWNLKNFYSVVLVSVIISGQQLAF